MADVLQQIANYFQQYGYWTLAVALLLENAGIPVPGETTLLVASALADSRHTLQLPLVILVGTLAAVVGDNLGYLLGRRGGRPLLVRYSRLFRLRPAALARGERLFQRYGPVTVFLARFIFGLRILAGPLAGVLRMPWPRFLAFNVLGALAWVTVVALLGYFFGRQLAVLVHTLRTTSVLLLVIGLGVVTIVGRRLLSNLEREEAG
jgi:membrane-associated protein